MIEYSDLPAERGANEIGAVVPVAVGRELLDGSDFRWKSFPVISHFRGVMAGQEWDASLSKVSMQEREINADEMLQFRANHQAD